MVGYSIKVGTSLCISSSPSTSFSIVVRWRISFIVFVLDVTITGTISHTRGWTVGILDPIRTLAFECPLRLALLCRRLLVPVDLLKVAFAHTQSHTMLLELLLALQLLGDVVYRGREYLDFAFALVDHSRHNLAELVEAISYSLSPLALGLDVIVLALLIGKTLRLLIRIGHGGW